MIQIIKQVAMQIIQKNKIKKHHHEKEEQQLPIYEKNGYSPNKLRVTEEEITEAVITTTTEAALEVTEMTEK